MIQGAVLSNLFAQDVRIAERAPVVAIHAIASKRGA
jgi:hypothetical protein